MALKRKWKGENIDPSFSSASFKTNFTVKKLRSMPSHFPTLIPFGHTMFKRCYWFLKSTWCAKSNLLSKLLQWGISVMKFVWIVVLDQV